MMEKKFGFILVIFFGFLFLSVVNSDMPQPSPKQCPINPEFLNPPSEHFGLLPHPVDLSHLKAAEVCVQSLPMAWDWRINGGVTSVKNQGSCGSCWAFAAMGDFESKVLIKQFLNYDFSEENLKECNYWGHNCGGGHAWSATNHFTREGVVFESCDPYHPYKTGNCNQTCAKIKQITGWRILPNDVNAIKQAVYQYGPVYTTMYASFPGFSTYDGTYCLYYPGSEAPNHAVLIVGWDDNMTHAGGKGAWIVKNSWGTSWGANGYFYIAYDSARIGQGSCYYESYKHYDYLEMMGTLYAYDEAGWYDNWGYGSPNNVAYGLVKFIANKDECINAVDFWAVDDNMSYDIYIYDTFDGTNVSGLLHAQSGTCSLAGYYSVDLTSPVWVKKGDDFVVVIKFTCSGYYYPVPCDSFAPIESGKCYLSLTGAAGSWVNMASYARDVSIRARSKNHQPVFDGHDFDGNLTSDVAIWRPNNGIWYIRNISAQQWGAEGDIPVNGRYNSDAVVDLAVWRPTEGIWYIKNIGTYQWGTVGDVPVPADYNGDNITDIAIWRPSNGVWYIKNISDYQWGQAGDVPVPGDYNGDNVTDIAVWRPSEGRWYIRNIGSYQWGILGDIPVPGDYDKDGKTDLAVWRPSIGYWYIQYSGGGTASIQWGASGDWPTPGDFNGDLVTDLAVWRPSTGYWYVKNIGEYQWGTKGDIPVVR